MTALPTFRPLPREARDTLFLLAVMAWIVAPLAGHLPTWCTAMAALLLLWRGWIALRGLRLPARPWMVALLLLASLATWRSHGTLTGRDAGVTLVVVLLALKTLEMRASRDTFVLFFLGFFTLLTNFFFSQSLLTALAMVGGLLGLLTALVNHHLPVGRPPLRLAMRTAAGMALLGAPIMVLLFVLFPRIAPLWGLPGDANSGRSGLSGRMEVGALASLALDDSVAMRLRFEGPRPPLREMYFRGPVFSRFDGREWLPGAATADPKLQVNGTPVRYELLLEGNNHPWLPLLDATPQPPELKGYTVRMGAELQWNAERPISELVRLQAQSYTQFRFGPLSPDASLQQSLDLPAGSNPRTQALAREIRSDARWQRADATKLVELLMEKLRTGGYSYTLDPGVYGRNAADEFWFDRKEGFCEHIASSFVVLMRALGVPARVVTGYLGGEPNPVDGWWTVRQSDAHAWAEVWMAGQGWVRVDPTSAVAPGRTGQLQRLAQPRNAVAQALVAISPGFLSSLRDLWEAGNSRWNQWVLNYSQARQLDMLRNIGFQSPEWTDLGVLLLGALAVASLVGAAWAQWERMRQDPWLRLLQAAHARLRRAGLDLPRSPILLPPRQLAEALRHGAAGMDTFDRDALSDWLLRLEAWRYAPTQPHGRAPLGTLRRQFRQLRWPRHLTGPSPKPLSP